LMCEQGELSPVSEWLWQEVSTRNLGIWKRPLE
jgi:hypothetical protein